MEKRAYVRLPFWALSFAVLAAWACPCAAQAQAEAASRPLAARIERLLADPLLRSSDVGMAVYDLTAGEPVFACREKKLHRPASVEKLVTAITALSELGPEHAFTTSAYRCGAVEDSVLQGDLYVAGGFDPEFGEAEMERIVQGVRGAGIRRIGGRLVGDVSFADSLYYGGGWSWDDAPYDFQPCLSPLMFCKGAVSVTVSPVPGDTAAAVTVTPASSYYEVRNEARCGRPEAGPLRVTRNWMEQGNVLTVAGNVTRRTTRRMSLHGSGRFFLHALAERLRQQGVEVADSSLTFGELPADSSCLVPLASVSHSLAEVAERALKQSDNLCAEAMLRHVALAGGKTKHLSAADGAEVVGRLIRRLGYDPEEFSIADGSGVSPYNYVTPDLLLAFLKYAYGRPELFAVLEKALPQAGVDGTLAHRMKGGSAYRRVRAKTGTVTGVSSLAGYAHTRQGHVLAFVILNQNVLKAARARAFQDKVCAELCR